MTTTVILLRPFPGANAVPVAVRYADGTVRYHSNFPRLREAYPEQPQAIVDVLLKVLHALSSARLSVAGADPIDVASHLFAGAQPESPLVRCLALLSEEEIDVPVGVAMLKLLPVDGSEREALLVDLADRLRRIADALRPDADDPDPFGRLNEPDPVLLASATARQASLASRAVRRFAAACRAAFGETPLLNEDGLPARPEDLPLLIASRATVEVDCPSLREAARKVAETFPSPEDGHLPALMTDERMDVFLSRCGEAGESSSHAIRRLVAAEDAGLVNVYQIGEEGWICRTASAPFRVGKPADSFGSLRAQVASAPPLPCTRRAVSPGAEALLGKVFPVLDHGEVELVDYMGTDAQLARIARCSTRSERTDLGIISHLVRNRHTSPIEFGKIVLRMKLPIFVARQFVRHRTGSFSEVSGRYRPPIGDVYCPPPDFVQARPDAASGVKQGRGADLRPEHAEAVREVLRNHAAASLDVFSDLYDGVEDCPGVAAELARSAMPLGTYTEWYWTTDAHNLMGWLRLRLDGHAQKEARAYAEAILPIFAAWLPETAAAFRRYILAARTLSERGLSVLGAVLAANLPSALGCADAYPSSVLRLLMGASGMSAGEQGEFLAVLRDLLAAGSGLASLPGLHPALRPEGFSERASGAAEAVEADLRGT